MNDAKLGRVVPVLRKNAAFLIQQVCQHKFRGDVAVHQRSSFDNGIDNGIESAGKQYQQRSFVFFDICFH